MNQAFEKRKISIYGFAAQLQRHKAVFVVFMSMQGKGIRMYFLPAKNRKRQRSVVMPCAFFRLEHKVFPHKIVNLARRALLQLPMPLWHHHAAHFRHSIGFVDPERLVKAKINQAIVFFFRHWNEEGLEG